MTRATTKTRGGLLPEKYLTEDQQRKLLCYVTKQADLARYRGKKRAIVDELIIFLFLNTGLRASEICALKIKDLPISHGKNVIVVRAGKRKTTRTIEISEKLQKRLDRFIKLYCKGAKPGDCLLINERKKPFGYFSIYSKIRRIGDQAGLKNLHPHVLRHTYLTRLYNIEHDLRFVQDQAGHASPKTTAIYAQTDQEARRRQVEAVDAANLLPG